MFEPLKVGLARIDELPVRENDPSVADSEREVAVHEEKLQKFHFSS